MPEALRLTLYSARDIISQWWVDSPVLLTIIAVVLLGVTFISVKRA
jgi:hypothetical protein